MSKQTKHTPEPWYIVATDAPDSTAISTKSALPTGRYLDLNNEVLGSSEYLRIRQEDLERIVACVNACAGIANPAAVRELIEAVRVFNTTVNSFIDPGNVPAPVYERIYAAFVALGVKRE